MNSKHEQILLKVACTAIEAAVHKKEPPAVKSDAPELNVLAGCFVTIKTRERLRGCLGQFTSDKPLIELVSEMAVSSATRDPRFYFDQVTQDELEYLDIEISVLSPMLRTDDPLSVRLGIDGIYIVNRASSGCFLPQVATETGWSAEQFLTNCCMQKANLPPEAWKDPETEVYFFTADVFGSPFAQI